jgi:hypothetical protein
VTHSALVQFRAYSNFVLVRVWEAFSKPPKYTAQIAVDDLKRAVERVLAEITKLLHHSQAELLDSVKEFRMRHDLQLAEIKNLNTKIESLGTQIKHLEDADAGEPHTLTVARSQELN